MSFLNNENTKYTVDDHTKIDINKKHESESNIWSLLLGYFVSWSK